VQRKAKASRATAVERAAVRVNALRRPAATAPSLGLILGSGFQSCLESMEVDRRISYRKLPGFPRTGVAGHAGELLLGQLSGTPILVLSGRAHFYEGHSMESITFGVRVLAACGVRDLLLTNAAGGLNPAFRPGDLMVVSDHINLMGENPLRGAPGPGLPRFLDLTHTYDSCLGQMLRRAARRCRLPQRRGVYLAVSGPTYETPAEIRAFARLGADAVGMSTVPEAIVARQLGMRVAAVSCITNLAAGRSKQALSHEEVLQTAARSKPMAARFLKEFIQIYGESFPH